MMPIYVDPACLALLETHYGRTVVPQPATPLRKMLPDPRGPIRIELGADGRLAVRYPVGEVVDTTPTACEVVEAPPLSEEEEEKAILQRWLARVLAPKSAA